MQSGYKSTRRDFTRWWQYDINSCLGVIFSEVFFSSGWCVGTGSFLGHFEFARVQPNFFVSTWVLVGTQPLPCVVSGLANLDCSGCTQSQLQTCNEFPYSQMPQRSNSFSPTAHVQKDLMRVMGDLTGEWVPHILQVEYGLCSIRLIITIPNYLTAVALGQPRKLVLMIKYDAGCLSQCKHIRDTDGCRFYCFDDMFYIY